jgi:hypothetical protein
MTALPTPQDTAAAPTTPYAKHQGNSDALLPKVALLLKRCLKTMPTLAVSSQPCEDMPSHILLK